MTTVSRVIVYKLIRRRLFNFKNRLYTRLWPHSFAKNRLISIESQPKKIVVVVVVVNVVVVVLIFVAAHKGLVVADKSLSDSH